MALENKTTYVGWCISNNQKIRFDMSFNFFYTMIYQICTAFKILLCLGCFQARKTFFI